MTIVTGLKPNGLQRIIPHPQRGSENLQRAGNRHSPINHFRDQNAAHPPMFIGTDPKKGKKEGGRGMFSFRPNAVNFNWWCIYIYIYLIASYSCNIVPTIWISLCCCAKFLTICVISEGGKFIWDAKRVIFHSIGGRRMKNTIETKFQTRLILCFKK